MPAAIGHTVVAEFILQPDVHRPGQVPGFVRVTPVGSTQLPPDIEDGRRVAGIEALGELGHRYEDITACSHPARVSDPVKMRNSRRRPCCYWPYD